MSRRRTRSSDTGAFLVVVPLLLLTTAIVFAGIAAFRTIPTDEPFQCATVPLPPNPTGIVSDFIGVSGNITSVIPIAPVLPANYHYLKKGDPANPIALLLHGFPDDPAEFRWLMDDLAANGYFAVAPSYRGYAPTTSPQLPPELAFLYLATDTIEIALQLGATAPSRVGQNVIIGHDWGSVIGQLVANRTAGVWAKFVSLGIPNLPTAVETFQNPTPELLQLQFYQFWFQITPILGNFIDDYAITQWDPIDLVQFGYELCCPLGYDQQIIDGVKTALSTDDNRRLALAPPRNLFNAPLPTDTINIPALYIFARLDCAFNAFLDINRMGPTIQRVKATSPNPNTFFFISNCGGHWMFLENVPLINGEVIKFLTV